MVVCSQAVASEHPPPGAGAMVLAQGGHAVDAAVALTPSWVSSVPWRGVGGDLFAMPTTLVRCMA